MLPARGSQARPSEVFRGEPQQAARLGPCPSRPCLPRRSARGSTHVPRKSVGGFNAAACPCLAEKVRCFELVQVGFESKICGHSWLSQRNCISRERQREIGVPSADSQAPFSSGFEAHGDHAAASALGKNASRR